MLCKEARFARSRGEIGIKSKHNVSVRARSFQTKARKQCRTIPRCNKLQITTTDRLKSRLDLRPRAPFRHKTIVSIDNKFRRLCRCKSRSRHKNSRSKCKMFHLILLILRRAEIVG